MRTSRPRAAMPGIRSAPPSSCRRAMRRWRVSRIATPQTNAQLEEARTQVQTLSAEPLAQQAAAHDLDAARASLNQADAALAQHKPPEVVDHLAYLARRHADAGQARVDEARARQEVAKAQDERNRILLESRTREAQNA